MRLGTRWRVRAGQAQELPELVEIVTPRTNTAVITPAENLFAAISRAEPFSLEIVATRQARWFLARAKNVAMRQHLEDQLGAAYPQADLRRLDLHRFPGLDPARIAPDEHAATCTLGLRGPVFLPLRTFEDAEVAANLAAQADPMLGILSGLGNLPEGWRSLSQLVLKPAPDDWSRKYLRLAVQHPLAPEHAAERADTSLTSVFLIAALLSVGALSYHTYQLYATAQWLALLRFAGGVSLGAPALAWLAYRLTHRPMYDARLVQEKINRIAYFAQLRLTVFAPATVPAAEVEAQVRQATAAYRQFNLAAGNGFQARPVRLRGRDLRAIAPLAGVGPVPVLNTRELAGLWHLPQAQADVPLLERTTARYRLPLPYEVARGCRVGVSTHQGHSVPVSLPDTLLRRHLLLVAKTRRGKSSLLLQIARYLMEAAPVSDASTGAATGATPPSVAAVAGKHPALVLVDPHHDLARAALGLVPPSRRSDVVYLDVSERERPFGLNLLDAGLGWDRDKAVANALTVFRREFDQFWGPRMEDAFRFALLSLYEANQAICAANPAGRSHQHTILQVPSILADPAFRRSVLDLVQDPVITGWWSGYFDRLDRKLQIEIINPVQTKVQRFAGSLAARAIVSQPKSTIDPAAWLRSGAIVIVNTAKGTVGEDTAALVGGSLINLAGLVVGEQAKLDATQRRPVTLLVDEFHTMPGADYESILSELAKYGANLVLATQSLARLAALDREQQRALRATVFANLDGLFAFHTSAEDAEYLVRELGGGIDEQDLLELGEHRCYARISAAGARLPSFSIHLDPPPPSDPATSHQLARASAATYGRPRAEVEGDLHSTLARFSVDRQAAAVYGTSSAASNTSAVPIADDPLRNAGRTGAMSSPARESSGAPRFPAPSPSPSPNDRRRQKGPRRKAPVDLDRAAHSAATTVTPHNAASLQNQPAVY